MHFNTGYQREALPLIRRFVQVFGQAEVVVAPSASCVSMVREIYPLAAEWFGERHLLAEIQALAPRVYELSEFLVHRLGLEDVGAYYPHSVTYHPTCHSLRFLHVGDAPLRLLRAVRGLDLIELPGAEECCGFGGTFAIKNADTSLAMLSEKLRNVLNTNAEVCVAADNSCLMHMGGALHRQRAGVRTMHLAEILASTEERGLYEYVAKRAPITHVSSHGQAGPGQYPIAPQSAQSHPHHSRQACKGRCRNARLGRTA